MKSRGLGAGVAAFFGWLLMGVGALIALTAGACSVIFLMSMIGSMSSYPDDVPNTLLMMLIFGGIPIAVGVVLFVAGRLLARVGAPRQLPPRRIEVPDEDGDTL